MTPPIYLMLVVHNHQPVGQFGYVNEHSTNVSYLPLIEALERHPRVKIGMHYSGPLLDWLKQNHMEVIERLRVLVARQQVEMISGGYYDPILVMLPDEDKIGQIEKMNAEIKDTLGGDALGMWVAERVWEPHLARPIAQAGLRYVIVEDAPFESVGFDKERDLFGYYITEEQGSMLAVFPTLTYLRYSIPWEPVPVLINWLRTQADQPLTLPQPKVAFMGDDGEKFGTWPGTYEHCWGDGKYMETLFTALERNSDWLKTATPSEYMAQYPALGRAYLPSASYVEMAEWSLPADRSHQLSRLKRELEGMKRSDVVSFMRGGIWRNFLVKYDEINHMHKRTLSVSRKIHDMRRGRKRDQALELLWAAQSNDAYWHGVFGGVYLFNFRVATYTNLIAAEDIADNGDLTMALQRTDFDCDSYEDVVLTGIPFNAYWNPARGGALLELDFRPAQYNLFNVMTRRKEGYHADLIAAAAEGSVITPMSAGVSDFGNSRNKSGRTVRAKENGLERLLIYDWHRRASFLDHFIGPSTTLDEFYQAKYAEQGDFVNQMYTVLDTACDGTQATVEMAREGHVWMGDIHRPVRVQKAFHLAYNNPTMTVSYALSSGDDEAINVRFGIETVVGFDGGQDIQYCSLRVDDDPTRRGLNERREFEGVRKYQADTNLRNITIRTDLSRPAFLWQFGLETITLSEAGFERGYQGTVFLQWWNVHLEPGETWRVTISHTIQQTATR
ncbi:MAG TPA: alpha-amylase/4-alpha-glucanotransferase domain-containing protein [Aggregatilineales bacterium]|nr:alpha-amylase/4-alpha-glucanotransferase domain-containing protein [Aggregatilineales bacterium]